MSAQNTTRHLLVRTANEIGRLERYHAICGASGITKREYATSVLQVGCPACLKKITPIGRKGKPK